MYPSEGGLQYPVSIILGMVSIVPLRGWSRPYQFEGGLEWIRIALLSAYQLTILFSYHITLPCYHLTILPSYPVVILPSYHVPYYWLTVLPAYNLTILHSYHLTILPSYHIITLLPQGGLAGTIVRVVSIVPL